MFCLGAALPSSASNDHPMQCNAMQASQTQLNAIPGVEYSRHGQYFCLGYRLSECSAWVRALTNTFT